jgi:PPM family protein phosphatase
MSLGQRAAITDPGRKRRRNEDAYVLEPPLFGIADGMGGAQAGEIASRIAAAVLQDSPEGADGAGAERVVGLIQEANRRVYERSSADEAVSGMGTTMTIALVEDPIVYIGHVGDSRAYLLRGDSLDQLTEDHSLVAELVRSGKLSPEEADTHPQRSVITRALGTDPDVDVDTFAIEARPGDVFMLCSDGLTSMVDDETILTTVQQNRGDLERAAKALVDAANKGGGEDNITIVLFEVVGDAEETATMPAVAPAPAPKDADDEQTLDELDRVPAVDTMVVTPAQARDWTPETRSQLRPPGGRAAPARSPDEAAAPVPKPEVKPKRRVSRLVLASGSLAVVLVLAALVVWGLSRSYFIGATKDGRVAVYQGFPWDLTGGAKLYRLRYESRLLAAQLSQAERKQLFGHDLVSYNTALRRVKQYESEVVP